jgi:hypothetical protein
MSVITDLLLVTTLDERDAVERVNAWCRDSDPRKQEFLSLGTDDAGGNKVFCAHVWAMSGNYFRHEALAEALPTFGWREPRGVVLVVDYEHNQGRVQVYRADGKRIEDDTIGGWPQ